MFTVISNDIQELRGIGMEVLIDIHGNFMARFYDGMFVGAISKGNNEETQLLLENIG